MNDFGYEGNMGEVHACTLSFQSMVTQLDY